MMPIFSRPIPSPERLALVDTDHGVQRPTTYGQLAARSDQVARVLLSSDRDLGERRVAFLEPPGSGYAVLQWGIWKAGGIAVPLATSHPARELAYVLDDAAPSIVVGHPNFAERLEPLALERGIRYLSSAALETATGSSHLLPVIDDARRALMVYTSGTTGRPKGVVTTHRNISAQITTLIEAWQWRPDDRIVHVLPLHHIHGIVNVLSCALWAGACCEFLPFQPEAVWDRFASGEITLFMAVPTIYARLIAAWEAASPEQRTVWSRGSRSLRLMVSGSAALPVGTLNRWREITGHTLLERYGMTEIGMGLSNPLLGERRAGTVGQPFPGVEIRLVDEEGTPVPEGSPGQVEIRGAQVFQEYWNRPEETAKAFRDGWFRTGDVAVVEDGYYRILGRQSVDIIKSAGYKISALEIEDVLREHPEIRDCAVVGVADPELGETVAAALLLEPGADLDVESLRRWAKERLAPYKVPKRVIAVPELPRNAMGKVTKPEVRSLF